VALSTETVNFKSKPRPLLAGGCRPTDATIATTIATTIAERKRGPIFLNAP